MSVALVLLFHVGLAQFQAGFIGVDVFFAISGFIITKLIHSELIEGTFSFTDFLKRRVARLMPALIVTVLATMAAGYFLLGPGYFDELSQSAVAALLSVSNIHFWLGSGYFDDASQAKPLLHTWSLGVEEQFYLVWPLMLLLAYRLARFWGLIALITIASGTALWGQLAVETSHPSAAFFLMPLRTYQFGVGALVALTGICLRGVIGSAFTLLSIAALIAIGVFASKQSGIIIVNVLPVLAACLAFASLDAPLARWVLGNPVMAYIGKRAYAIYLVHWPLIVLWPQGEMFSEALYAVPAQLALSLMLGEVLHRFVERPVRIRSSTSPKRRETILWATPIMLAISVGASAWVIAGRGLPDRFSKELAKAVEKAIEDRSLLFGGDRTIPSLCSFNFNEKPDPLEVIGNSPCTALKTGKTNILAIGDSFLSDSFEMLQEHTQPELNWNGISLDGCSPMIGGNSPNTPKHARHLRDNCKAVNRIQRAIIEKNKYDIILLTASWRKRDLPDLELALKYLSDKNITTILIGSRASFNIDLVKDIYNYSSINDANTQLINELDEKIAPLNESLREMASRHGAFYIDVLSEMCKSKCPAFDRNDELIYVDTHHLSSSGAEFLVSIIYNDKAFEASLEKASH